MPGGETFAGKVAFFNKIGGGIKIKIKCVTFIRYIGYNMGYTNMYLWLVGVSNFLT